MVIFVTIADTGVTCGSFDLCEYPAAGVKHDMTWLEDAVSRECGAQEGTFEVRLATGSKEVVTSWDELALLQCGDAVEAAPISQERALTLLKQYTPTPSYSNAIQNGTLKVVQLLVLSGEESAESNTTALGLAVRCGQYKTTRFLLNMGAPVSAKDSQGKTPLEHAMAQKGGIRLALAVLLLKRGAKLTDYAKSDTEVAQLTNLGLDVLAHRNCVNGTSFACEAMAAHNTELAQHLLDRGADISDPTGNALAAVLRKDTPNDTILEALLTSENLGWMGTSGTSTLPPLHYVVKRKSFTLLQRLIAAKADVNLLSTEGVTPLLVAVRCGWEEGVRMLIASNAAVDVKCGREGGTVLHEAIGIGSTRSGIAKMLIAGGCALEVRDRYSTTPLHKAVWLRQFDVVKELLTKGASAAAQNSKGTVEDAARIRGTPEMCALIETHLRNNTKEGRKSGGQKAARG